MGPAAAALVYAGVTALLFRALLPDLGTHLYVYPGDPLLNASILAWNAWHVPLSEAWWNFPGYAPLTGVTAFTEHLLLAYPVASPVIWLTGNPVLAFNVVYLLSYPLNGLCAYALAREVTGRPWAAFIGGLAFAFAPYQAVHMTHLQMLMAFGVPLTLLGLHRAVIARRRSGLAVFALGWLCAALANAYTLVFVPVLVVVWSIWFVRPREWRTLVAPLAIAVSVVLLMAPLLWGYHVRQEAHGLTRQYHEVKSFAADVTGVVHVFDRTTFWRGVLPQTSDEGAIFPGAAIAGLALVAVAGAFGRNRRRNPAIGYGVAVVVLWMLALGPEPEWSASGQALVYGPYRLLMALPGGESIRVPARAWLPAAGCLAVLASLGAAALLARYPRRARLGLCALAVLIVAEGWFSDVTVTVPRPMRAGIVPPGALVIDLPVEESFWNAIPQYRAVMGGYRTINGYSGYEPPSFRPLRRAIADLQPDAFEPYRRREDLYVMLRQGETPAVARWIATLPGAQRLFDVEDAVVYRLPRRGGATTP